MFALNGDTKGKQKTVACGALDETTDVFPKTPKGKSQRKPSPVVPRKLGDEPELLLKED